MAFSHGLPRGGRRGLEAVPYRCGKRSCDSAEQPTPTQDEEHTQGLSPRELRLADQIIRQFGGGYEVGHVALFWFIDKRGNLRATLDSDALPTDIAANLEALLRER